MPLSEKLIDKRVLRRSLDRGAVSKNDYEQYLAELPDLAGKLQRAEPGDGGPSSPSSPPSSPPTPE